MPLLGEVCVQWQTFERIKGVMQQLLGNKARSYLAYRVLQANRSKCLRLRGLVDS